MSHVFVLEGLEMLAHVCMGKVCQSCPTMLSIIYQQKNQWRSTSSPLPTMVTCTETSWTWRCTIPVVKCVMESPAARRWVLVLAHTLRLFHIILTLKEKKSVSLFSLPSVTVLFKKFKNSHSIPSIQFPALDTWLHRFISHAVWPSVKEDYRSIREITPTRKSIKWVWKDGQTNRCRQMIVSASGKIIKTKTRLLIIFKITKIVIAPGVLCCGELSVRLSSCLLYRVQRVWLTVYVTRTDHTTQPTPVKCVACPPPRHSGRLWLLSRARITFCPSITFYQGADLFLFIFHCENCFPCKYLLFV